MTNHLLGIPFIFSAILFLSTSCSNLHEKGNESFQKIQIEKDNVKSVLLYHDIEKYALDTIKYALDDVNQVVRQISPSSAGYSLWKVQSDTIDQYRLFIQGAWADQAAYDTIHVNPDFRKVLDKYKSIFDQTRKWELYRRFERVE